ncbi:helix-turn-helix domain-containing protein [Promicromonospora soli]
MTTRDEVRDFLRSRRARITPQMAGITPSMNARRVPGLRREEVALLAGVSVDYYNRFERGDLSGASDSVLESLARALQLDEAERSYLFDLARAASASKRRPTRAVRALKPSVQRLIDSMVGVPAFVQNGRMDVLGMNQLARALYAPTRRGNGSWEIGDPEPRNFARYLFLDPAAPDDVADWDAMARDSVAILRRETGRDPENKALFGLIGELSAKSPRFRTLWAAHDVRLHTNGTKQFHHPVVGDFELTYDAMDLPGQAGLTLIAYSAEPDTPSYDALRLLASWAATVEAEAAEHTDAAELDQRSPRSGE